VNVQVRDSSAPDRLGRYRLIAGLGQGGMGMIHLAVAEGIGGFRKLFVIKELKRELSENQQFLSLFMREAKLAARLSHPNVVHTVEADQDAGRYYLAMEFLDGRPFNEILRRAAQPPSVPLGLRLQVICHALTGLHHAHELTDYDGRALHVVHRDVSPANIFVTYDGQVKVLDFGVASAANSVESSDPPTFKGKIGYAAPEQLRFRLADRRTDVFGCGVVLWEAIALRQLVRGRPSRQIFESRLLGTEPRIAQLVDDVDPRLAEICDRATCHDPEQRYASAEDFCRDLQAFLAERSMSVEPSQMGALMRTKFAHERDTLHRLIEAQLGEEGEATSAVLRREAGALELDPAFSLAERKTTSAMHSLRPSVLLRRRKVRSRLLASLALVALTGTAAWHFGDDGPPPQPSAEERRLQASSTGKAKLAQATGSSIGPMSSDAGHTEPRSVAPTHPQAEPLRRAGADGTKPAPGRSLQRSGSAVEQEGAAPSRVQREGTQPSRAAPPAPGEVRGSARERDLDVDLHRVPHGERRSLDLENPFR
jgi:eukaryotic-like serine/threonine-protein kinase